eukprot:2962302-Karenia_brevis.AAC.1
MQAAAPYWKGRIQMAMVCMKGGCSGTIQKYAKRWYQCEIRRHHQLSAVQAAIKKKKKMFLI